MWRLWISAAVLAFVQSLTSFSAWAEKRAFVVGIGDYQSIAQLKTPANDADVMGNAFTKLGFRVEILKSATRAEFDKKWSDFLASLKDGDSAIFYFAGHGLQVDGVNYLLPKDTPDLKLGEPSILNRAIPFNQVMEELEARKLAATLYILDACRNNPFKDVAGKPAKSVLAKANGLARMESLYGAFVMYSAGADETALDSLPSVTSANSVYVHRLLPLLSASELSLVDIAKRVQVQVEEDSKKIKHQQRPAYFDGIVGQYYLSRSDNKGRPLGPADRIPGDNFVRVGAFATWDTACKSRPAPRIAASAPNFGRIVTRYETFAVAGTHFGNPCDRSSQRGVGVYYVIDDANSNSTAVESLQLTVSHWSVTPATTVKEAFEIDLATHFSKRVTAR